VDPELVVVALTRTLLMLAEQITRAPPVDPMTVVAW
jgi:hypothetical protein